MGICDHCCKNFTCKIRLPIKYRKLFQISQTILKASLNCDVDHHSASMKGLKFMILNQNLINISQRRSSTADKVKSVMDQLEKMLMT